MWGNHSKKSLAKQASLNQTSTALMDAAGFQPDYPHRAEGCDGHLPFLYWLVRQWQPQHLVFLNGEVGAGYFALCQTVKSLELNTHCHGIFDLDSVKPSTGGISISAIESYNDREYGDFSRLTKTSVSQALQCFNHESIDLLLLSAGQLAGHQPSEDYHQDLIAVFESWLPKLKPGALVVIFDISTSKDCLIINPAWEKLKRIYSDHIEFEHDHGLGVLQIGRDKGSPFAPWLLVDNNPAVIRRYFAALGHQGMGQSMMLRGSAPTQALAISKSHNVATAKELELSTQLTHRYQSIGMLKQQLAERDQALSEQKALVGDLYKAQEKITQSVSWQILAPLRWSEYQVARLVHLSGYIPLIFTQAKGMETIKELGHRVLKQGVVDAAKWLLREIGVHPSLPSERAKDRHDYATWVALYDTMNDARRAKIRMLMSRQAEQPNLAVLMSININQVAAMEATLDSLLSQLYIRWHLYIPLAHDLDASMKNALERYQERDERIHLVLQEPEQSMGDAMAHLSQKVQADWMTMIEAGDTLPEQAFAAVMRHINEQPQAVIFFSDHDEINAKGIRVNPLFKSEWNIDAYRSKNTFGHLAFFKLSSVRDTGGLRAEYDLQQTYDLGLRMCEGLEPKHILHIPQVLYHVRKPEIFVHRDEHKAQEQAKRAVEEHLLRQKVTASVRITPHGHTHVNYAVKTPLPRVSIIIPTRNRLDLMTQCIDSIREHTTYPAYDLLIVDNGSDDPEILSYFAHLNEMADVKVIRDDSAFNYSALNNLAASHADGEYLLLLNNDTEVITHNWLEEMVGLAQQPGVGVVGACLWYPDYKLQHGGVLMGLGGVVDHVSVGLKKGERGYDDRLVIPMSMMAVTGACLLVKKSLFDEVGGLNEHELKVAFNDVDLCLKIWERGYRVVWTPHAELFHHESASRGLDNNLEKRQRHAVEIEYLNYRWGHLYESDPSYNPNLNLKYNDFGLAFPPRFLPL